MKVCLMYTEMYPVLYIGKETFEEETLLEIPDDIIHNYKEAERNLQLAKKNVEIYAKNKGYKIKG